MKYYYLIVVGAALMWTSSVYLAVRTIHKLNVAVARTISLNKRADVMEKEWRALDLRIKKQEGIKHGYGH